MDARFLVAMLLAGCSSSGGAGEAPPAPAQPPHETTTAAPSFTWPVPDGWRSETIPFPLEFAPSIPHRGVEEIRFAPGFFDPAAPGYWTYAFAWVVTGARAPDAATLGEELTTYFRGLAAAVASGKKDLRPIDVDRIRARIGGDLRGSVATFDAFGDGRAVDLEVKVTVQPCGSGQAVLFTAAPRGRPPISPSPAEVVRSFRCTGRQDVKSSRGG